MHRTALLRLTACLGVLILATSPAAHCASQLRLLAERPVPSSIVWAFDIRWASESSVLIAGGKAGVFEISASDQDGAPKQLIPGSDTPGGFWLSSLLARSSTHLVAGAPVFSYTWSALPKSIQQQIAFDAIVDLDVRGDRLVILGGLKDETGRFAPDGAIGWLGPIEAGREGLRPVLYSIYGPGAEAMGECGILGLGSARFLPDDSFVLIPGVEQGVFWYSKDGELQRAWESTALRLEDDCKPMLGRSGPLAVDPHARNRWLGQRRIVDEILPLPDGPGVIIRQLENGEVHWSMATLKSDGKVSWLDLPFKGSSIWSHLKGDVQGKQIAFLVVEHGKEKPSAVPRIVFAELVP